MNKIIIGLLSISLATNAYLLGKPKEVVIKESEPEKVVVKETGTVTVTDKSLQVKYDALMAELTETKNELASAKSELELVNDRIALAELNEELKNIKAIELDKDGKPNGDTLDKFKQREESFADLYKKESIDESWAYETKSLINQVLLEKGDLSLYEISSLECKTTICEASLNPYNDSSGSGMAAGMNAMMSISQDKKMEGYITSFHFDDKELTSSGQVRLYIAKPVKGGSQ